MAQRLLSQAEWAREQGVSKAYVSKLVRTGRIELVDGKVDPEAAAFRMAARQDAIKHAKKLTGLTGEPELTAQSPQPELTGNLGVVHSVDPAEHDVRSDEIETKLLPDQLLRARIKREREEGRLKELERRRREGDLVEAEEVREQQTRRATEEREALLNWPARVSALIAVELGIDHERLLQVLRKHIRQHLAERSKA